jgi:hypothetical protein
MIRYRDNAEIVSFSFPFTELSEMYAYNSYLIYEAMANVPIGEPYMPETVEIMIIEEKTEERIPEIAVREPVIYIPDLWRNKWLYLRGSLNFPIVTYQLKPDGLSGDVAIYDPGPPLRYSVLNHGVAGIPGTTIGAELQFFNWMSAELDLEIMFGDPFGYFFFPGIGFQLKFPIKPGKFFMIEPYLASRTMFNIRDEYESYPFLGIGGGLQFGIKGGNSGAFFADLNFIYNLQDVVMKNTNSYYRQPETIHYNSWIIGIGIGYKYGFFDR